MSGWALLIGLAAMFVVSGVWHYRNQANRTRGAASSAVGGSSMDGAIIGSDMPPGHGWQGGMHGGSHHGGGDSVGSDGGSGGDGGGSGGD